MLGKEPPCTQDPGAMGLDMVMEFLRIQIQENVIWDHGMKVEIIYFFVTRICLLPIFQGISLIDLRHDFCLKCFYITLHILFRFTSW